MLPLTTTLIILAHALVAAAGPPSFVFILSESRVVVDGRLLRPDSLARIPNIRARLAGGSVRFDSAYSTSPVCAPSRSSLHSGRAPHKIAHEHNGELVSGVFNNYEGLPPTYSTRLDQLLNASGYATLIAGKTDWTVGGHSLANRLECLTFNVRWPYNITADGGWNQEPGSDMCASDGPVSPGGSGGASGSLYADDWRLVGSVAAFAASAPRPFYAFAGTGILHPAYRTNEYWFNRASNATTAPAWPPLEELHPCDLQAVMKRGCAPGFDNSSARADFYDPARIARVRRVYLAELEELDAMVGSVVDALRAAGRWDADTYLVLSADHGDMQLEHQMFYKVRGGARGAAAPRAAHGPRRALLVPSLTHPPTNPPRLPPADGALRRLVARAAHHRVARSRGPRRQDRRSAGAAAGHFSNAAGPCGRARARVRGRL